MRYIVLLVVLFSCVKEDLTPCKKTCISMEISNAIPIQFWLNGQQSFNEGQECGMTQVCFCQPFNCDDEIVIQIMDSSGNEFNLILYDSLGNQITSIPFDDVDGVLSVSITPNQLSPSICEKVIISIESDLYHTLYDYEMDDAEQAFTDRGAFTNAGVSPNGLGWTQTTNYTTPQAGMWVYDGNPAIGMELTVMGQSTVSLSETLYQTFPRISGNLKLSVTGTFDSFSYNGSTQINIIYNVLRLGSIIATHTRVIQSDGSSPDSGNFNEEIDFGNLVNADEIRIYVTRTGISTIWSISGLRFTKADLRIENYVSAESDCIDLRSTHDCTKILCYTNSSDFDGIDYESSPAPTFYLRIPARWIDQQNPQTVEDIELSNGVIVTLRQTIQRKKLLEIGYMPDYMHEKVQLALMHDTVLIGDTINSLEEYRRRDVYDAPPVDNYPLKKATVLLTKYNSVKKNTI